MGKAVLTAVAFGVVGCGGSSGKATVNFANPEESVSFDMKTTDGEDAGPLPSDAALRIPYLASGSSDRLGEAGSMEIALQQRVVSATTVEPRVYGVGAFVGTVSLNPGESQPHPLFVEEWEYTGDTHHPFVIKGHSFTRLGKEGAGTYDVEFEAPTDCSNRFVPGPMYLCGNSVRVDQAGFTGTLGEGGGNLACPKEVTEPFVAAGQGAKATFTYSDTVKVEGASKEFECTTTMDYDDRVICGAKNEVKVAANDACSWKVSAFAAPTYSAQQGGNYVHFWVGAVTTGCDQVAWCNSEWVAPE